MKTLIFLLLFAGLTMAAVDLTPSELLGNVTAPIVSATGEFALLGFVIAALLGFLAIKSNIGVPALLFGAALVLAIMLKYSFISTGIGYAALIVVGIISGIGVARWLGVL